jgi:G3E family GTPase
MDESTNISDNGKAEVVILAGFLGAGKTTLLRRILSWETDLSDTVVIVNEFGKVGIDGSLLRDAASDMVELTSGCICCTLKPQLNAELRRIWEQFRPKRVLIEATGVADPEAILDAFQDRRILEHMAVYKVITVLDSDYWPARDHFGPLFFNQLIDADLILLNKVDLMEEQSIPVMLKEIHEEIPDAQVVPTLHCAVDPETLWSVTNKRSQTFSPEAFFPTGHIHDAWEGHCHDGMSAGHATSPHSGSHDSHHHTHDHIQADKEGYAAFSFEHKGQIQEKSFRQFLDELPWELFRLKGPVRFEDRTAMINYVGGKCEWAEWQGSGGTRLAFVGLNVDQEEILERLYQCLVSD